LPGVRFLGKDEVGGHGVYKIKLMERYVASGYVRPGGNFVWQKGQDKMLPHEHVQFFPAGDWIEKNDQTDVRPMMKCGAWPITFLIHPGQSRSWSRKAQVNGHLGVNRFQMDVPELWITG
jgi:hypothetical protein